MKNRMCPILNPLRGKLQKCIEEDCGFWSSNSDKCGVRCLGTLSQEMDTFIHMLKQWLVTK